MPNESFQHTEPTHVYRTKQPRGALAYAAMMAVLSIMMLISSIYEGNPVAWIMMMFFICIMGTSLNQALRHKLVISPAGMSITNWHTMATPWSNVTGLQVFTFRLLGMNAQIPCLVLHAPPLGKQQNFKKGIPAELHGRIVPLFIQNWERHNEIEQDLQQYLPQPVNNVLFVSHIFILNPEPDESRNSLLLIGLIMSIVVASFVYAVFF